jgi:hypothetical protein
MESLETELQNAIQRLEYRKQRLARWLGPAYLSRQPEPRVDGPFRGRAPDEPGTEPGSQSPWPGHQT